MDVVEPYAPLTQQEIAKAVGILRSDRELSDDVRVCSLVLEEPPKGAVDSAVDSAVESDRRARAVLLERSSGLVSEVVVSLTTASVESWSEIPGVQPRCSSRRRCSRSRR